MDAKQLTADQIEGVAEFLFLTAKERVEGFTPTDQFRVLNALTNKLDDHLNDMHDPDDDTAEIETGNPIA